jgi:hypothetical protein
VITRNLEVKGKKKGTNLCHALGHLPDTETVLQKQSLLWRRKSRDAFQSDNVKNKEKTKRKEEGTLRRSRQRSGEE